MKSTDELNDALAIIAALQTSLSTANARIRELEALGVRQNDRIIDVMRRCNNAEQSYSELRAKWQLARRR